MADIVKRIVTAISNFMFGWTKELFKIGSPQERKDIQDCVTEWCNDSILNVSQQITGLVGTPFHMSPEYAYSEYLLLKDKVKNHVFRDVAVGIAGEVLSLGQVEVMGNMMQYVTNNLGINDMLKPFLNLPFNIAIQKPTEYYYNSLFTPMIPGSQDLIRFAVREAWRPDLQEGTPDFVIQNMKYQGYSDQWSKYYWASHWIIPTYEQAREAFWRGIITMKGFEDLRKYADLAPAYNNVWSGLQYNLPELRQARWLREWGLIDHSEFIKLLNYRGVHPDWIEKVVLAEERNLLRSEAERVRTALVALYKDGYRTKDQLRTQLNSLGLYPDSIELLIQEADFRLELDGKNDHLKIVLTLLKTNKISEEEFIARCRTLGMTEDAIYRQVQLYQASLKA